MELNLASLQNQLALIDLMSRSSRGQASSMLERLVLKHENIKIKMYQEKQHARAHFHVDYGKNNHVATYAIDTGERIEGTLDRKYDKSVSAWAAANRENLMAVWRALQSGTPESPFIQSLSAM
ncbi:UNVERIFIED_ORG: hypothetical protein ABIC48_000688 [Burkholderia territorii]